MGDQQVWAGRVTFALTAASAGVQALQQALKDAPEVVATPLVPDMTTGAWNYLPLVLISLAALIWIWERMFRWGEAAAVREADTLVGAALKAVSEPPPAPLNSPKPPENQQGRNFIEEGVSYADLVDRLAGKTDLQKDALTAPYRGKWMRNVGLFNDVTSSINGGVLVFIRLERAGSVACAFNAEWREQIAAINVGDLVTFDGMLDSLTRGAKFKDCEIVEVRPPPKTFDNPKSSRPRKRAAPKGEK